CCANPARRWRSHRGMTIGSAAEFCNGTFAGDSRPWQRGAGFGEMINAIPRRGAWYYQFAFEQRAVSASF
ncbi:MAG TPA: hypothetical protein VNL16_06480, partial [Chloroflexota bacterium]|nr:hypothetical protein [Chloroflexota bacterium]